MATLDKEITDGEAAQAAEIKAAAQKARELAQSRINAAQREWWNFDAAAAASRTREGLDATRQSAKRLEEGLSPPYAQQLATYNSEQYEKRLAALSR